MRSILKRSTRRDLLKTGAALPFALSPIRGFGAEAPQWVLLGTDTGKGIYRARWDAKTGVLGTPELALEAVRPCFFADHPGRLPVMYSADEGKGATATISAVRYDAATGAVKLLNRVFSGSDGPCYVSASAELVFSANYTGGTFLANRLHADGSLELEEAAHEKFVPPPMPHPGPVPDRQDKPHLHSALVADGYCFVCDLAGDRIFTFPLAAQVTTALYGEPMISAARPGSGPRHIVALGSKVGWPPKETQRYYLVIHEIDCTVEMYTKSKAEALTRGDGSALSTLPKGTDGKGSTASEIVVSPDRRFVYTATRGANLLTVFPVQQSENSAPRLLEAIQHLSCGGEQPRWIGLDPSGRWLMSCNQAGNCVAMFARDEKTGKLTQAGEPVKAVSPMCAQWLVAKQ